MRVLGGEGRLQETIRLRRTSLRGDTVGCGHMPTAGAELCRLGGRRKSRLLSVWEESKVVGQVCRWENAREGGWYRYTVSESEGGLARLFEKSLRTSGACVDPRALMPAFLSPPRFPASSLRLRSVQMPLMFSLLSPPLLLLLLHAVTSTLSLRFPPTICAGAPRFIGSPPVRSRRDQPHSRAAAAPAGLGWTRAAHSIGTGL